MTTLLPPPSLPKLTARTTVEEWELAQVQGRTLRVRVRIRTVVDVEGGKFIGLMVTPFAIVVTEEEEKEKKYVLELPEGGDEPASGLVELLGMLLDPLL